MSNWVVDVAQIAGVLFSAWAVWHAGRARAEAKKASAEATRLLAIERRAAFELENLRELWVEAATGGLSSTSSLMLVPKLKANPRLKAFVALLGPDVLPLTSAAVGIPSDSNTLGRTLLTRSEQRGGAIAVSGDVAVEIHNAVRHRISRPPLGP